MQLRKTITGMVAVLLTTALAPLDAPAQTPVIPAKPAAKMLVPPDFAAEVAGRRLLLQVRNAYRAAPSVRFNANWQQDRTTGTETLAAAPAQKRLRVTLQPSDENTTRIYRGIADGADMLVSRYEQQKKGDQTAARTFVKLPIAPEDSLARALWQTGFYPRSKAADLLLTPDWTVRGQAWQDDEKNRDGSVFVWETVTEPAGRDQSAPTTVVRRYRIAPKTSHLLGFEEWTTRTPAKQKDKAQSPPITVYRRDDYQDIQLGGSLAASLWEQALPGTYRETPLPRTNLPPVAVSETMTDPNARKSLERWRTAMERLTSLSLRAEVLWEREVNQNEAARIAPEDRSGRALWNVFYRRPEMLRVQQETVSGPRQFQYAHFGVADGQEIVVEDRRRDRTRRQPIRGDNLQNAARRAGLETDGLEWLLGGDLPRADQIVYTGEHTLADGATVQVVEFRDESTGSGRRGRRGGGGGGSVAVNQWTRIGFGADGIPRWMQEQRHVEAPGLFARDQPGDVRTTITFRDVEPDATPPTGAFDVPAAKGR